MTKDIHCQIFKIITLLCKLPISGSPTSILSIGRLKLGLRNICKPPFSSQAMAKKGSGKPIRN